jgi:protein-L-isoaspartate(D-aspartate) O-methyltransferase
MTWIRRPLIQRSRCHNLSRSRFDWVGRVMRESPSSSSPRQRHQRYTPWLLTVFGLSVLAAVGLDSRAPRQPPACDRGDGLRHARAVMVADQIAARGIGDRPVLAAMRAVPRHCFVPPELATAAYQDRALPIGFGQTISQPYIVAYMTEALRLAPAHRVLEIGTGSGYQAAVLAQIVKEVHTIEIVPALADRARALLRELGYANVHVVTGDGYAGLPDRAPFDRIIVTAAPDHVPQPLVDQLAVGGRMIIPVGGGWRQQLMVLTRSTEGIASQPTLDVLFVPLTRGERKP